MEFLKEIYDKRKKYFENLDYYLNEIKEIVKNCRDAEIYIYGSVVEGNYSIGLSDIDVAIVSDEFEDRNRRLEVFGILTKNFIDSPFEFHVLSRKQWNFYLNFIRKYRKV